MSSEYDKRAAVITALRAGHSPVDIVHFLKLPKSTVYRISQQFEESGQSLEPERKSHASRSDIKHNAAFLEQLQTQIDEAPSVSMQKLAQQLNVREATIRKAVHEDLRYK
jgi:transposase